MASVVDSAEIHRISSEEYQRMVDSGALEDLRVELIDGLLCDMSPPTPEHDDVTVYLNRVLATTLDHDRFELRVGCALTIGNSAPQPDFAIVRRGTPKPYHPSGAELVIEVAFSSLRRDLLVKPRIYASAGVTEYWVIDIGRRRALAHREPRGTDYRLCAELGADDVLDGSFVGIGQISVGDVLAAASRG